MRKGKALTPEQIEDADRLRRIWDEKKQASQEAFGAEFGLGTQGNVTQYLNQHIPLNLEAVVKFARGLGVSIEDISPRLAAFLAEVPLRAIENPKERRMGDRRGTGIDRRKHLH